MAADFKQQKHLSTSVTPSADHQRFVDKTVIPILSKAEHDPDLGTDGIKKLKLPLFGGMVAFMIAFALFEWSMPNTTIGEIITFIAFPIFFFVMLASMAFLYRNRIAEAMVKGRDNFLIRTEVLTALFSRLELDYVPLPGGPSKSIKLIAGWRYCPQILKDFHALMDDHGGFDDVANIIRESGIARPREIILATEKNREDAYKRQIENEQFHDGIKGVKDGIPFSALEWSERLDETTRHHLLIALKLPTRLTGRVEFKNKAGRWPMVTPKWKKRPVKLISKDFTQEYDVRACDQVEARLIFDPAVIERLTAYSAGDAVCGIAFDDHLVVSLQGRNRFDLLDLASGAWSKDTIQTTLDDVAELIGFVETVSRAFAVKPQRQTA